MRFLTMARSYQTKNELNLLMGAAEYELVQVRDHQSQYMWLFL